MKPRSLEQTSEVGDPSKAGIAFGRDNDVTRHSRAQSHLALAQISKPARSAHVSIRRERLHVDHCVRRGRRVIG
jgi:hypothetical protein